MPLEFIVVRGAREHNLKNINVDIPRDRLVVITGLSGSGKSSLAFDTIYAEGQRRYVESLSAYARQFLGQMEKPDVDYIDGLSPAISIDQKGASRNPRSTVGTQTEIYDYLRLLYARAGRPHCHNCGRPIQRQTVQQIVDSIMNLPEGRKLMILGPVVRDRKGEHGRLLDEARKAGFVRVRVDGVIFGLDDEIDLDKKKRHSVEVVVDRLMSQGTERDSEHRSRVTDSVETALRLGQGVVQVWMEGNPDSDSLPQELLYSEQFACVHCGTSLGELEPRNFSFNSPHGACKECSGLGVRMEVDPELVIQNQGLSLAEGAILPWWRSDSISQWHIRLLEAVAAEEGFSVDVPVKMLKRKHLNILLYGRSKQITVNFVNKYGRSSSYGTTYEGVVPNLERRYRETESDYVRQEIERYMAESPCPACCGARLKPESLAVRVDGRNIHAVCTLSVVEVLDWVESLRGVESPLGRREMAIATQILKEIASRLTFLRDVGVDYLTLDRRTSTLSGGEAQRIRLATQIGSSLMGVLYVCDEPSIGLHPADDYRLIATLKRLRDLGNTVLVVEHDEAMIRSADYVIDLGPGAGQDGGYVVAEGTPETLAESADSVTGHFLSGRREISLPAVRRKAGEQEIVIHGARENNLKNLEVTLPLGQFIVVTGVSGSGKSTLVDNILHRKGLPATPRLPRPAR